MTAEKPFRLTSWKPKESDVVVAVKTVLSLRGYLWVRLQSAKLRTPDGRWQTIGDPGIPDYVAVHQKYPAVFVEVKRPGGELRDTQLQWIWEKQMGYKVAVAVVDSAQELSAFLDQHEQRGQQ